MTAEIAILNKAVVALAADSAMTIGGIEKVYPGDKLFPLSSSEPIGVMIYGNAEFMGVPWETLVKMYHRERGDKPLPTVRAYMDDLLDFVTGPNICTEEAQRDNTLAVVVDSFQQIHELVLSEVDGGQPPNASLKAGIEAYNSVLSRHDEHISRSQTNKLISQLQPDFNDAIDSVFGREFDMRKSVRTSLYRTARLALERDRLSLARSGVVVAGFGEEELFPAIVIVETDGFIESLRLTLDETRIVRNVRNAKTDEQGVDFASAAIIPLAQRDMVEIFMDGVDPDFLEWLTSIEELLFDFGEEVADATRQLNDRQREVLREDARQRAAEFLRHARGWMQEEHSDPVIEVVEHLPKQELADMAEALVSMTSLKRRISRDHEDVGGPIDVATISKGDGFQWAKGKHVNRSSR